MGYNEFNKVNCILFRIPAIPFIGIAASYHNNLFPVMLFAPDMADLKFQ